MLVLHHDHHPSFRVDELLGMFISYYYKPIAKWSRSALTVGTESLIRNDKRFIDISAIVYEHYVMCCT